MGAHISRVYGLGRRLLPASDSGFRVITYHAVGTPVPGDTHSLFNVTPARFAEHMEFLASGRYGSVHAFTALRTDGVAITFDDGYRDNLTVAAPVLARLGLPFTVFITPSFVQSGRPIYMSPVGVRELAALPGAQIGAHGLTHQRLTLCSPKELAQELQASKHWLEDLLGQPVPTMAYPHGATNMMVRTAAQAAGYQLAGTSFEGANLARRAPLNMARTTIFGSDDIHTFEARLRGDWDWMQAARSLLGREGYE